MARVLLCSTPRVGSVSYAEKLSQSLQLPLAFQPWEPYAFNKQPEHVKATTIKYLNSKDVLVHSHIHACIPHINTFDQVIYIGRRDRIRQAWSFFIALHIGKMQNINLSNLVVPEPSESVVKMFIDWINLWDQYSQGQHRVFYEELELENSKWNKNEYSNVKVSNFNIIEARIRNECKVMISFD